MLKSPSDVTGSEYRKKGDIYVKLRELLPNIDSSSPLRDTEVREVTSDTRQLKPGDLFVALRGGAFDGHKFAKEALASGACAVVCEYDLGLENQVITEDTRIAYASICAALMGNPHKSLTMIGVTGTNGKTTVTHIIKHILTHCGYKTGLIGTINNQIGDLTIPAKYTTPDPKTLFSTLRRMVDMGCTHAVMEVSSHGLSQNRVSGIQFEAGVFTNLTQDHLDYHGDMESYFAAKKLLFDISNRAVINYDDEYGIRLASELLEKAVTFSTRSDSATYTARNIKVKADGSSFAFVGEGIITRVKIPMPGEFSVSNAMAAIAACMAVGVPLQTAAEAAASCPGVSGRFELIYSGDFTVIRDYAHTPDGLLKAISAIKSFAAGRVVTLFGCAGDRDRTKRPIMAEAVAANTDFAILTSDNPRREDPQRIIDDALPGLLKHNVAHKVIVDRYEAIKWALDNARKNDILLLAGKGHEDYQVLDFGTIYFDEKEIVGFLLSRKNSSPEDK